MKKILFTFLTIAAFTQLKAEIIHETSEITLDAAGENFTTVVIEGKNVNFSHWSFDASGFQIDGNNDFVGMVEGVGSANLKRISEGDPVSDAGDFVSLSDYAPAYHSELFGPDGDVITDGESTFFGFKVISGGNTHYAWLKLTRTSSNVVVINEYAWETSPGVAINAGETDGGGGDGDGDASIATTSKVSIKLFPNPAQNQMNIVGIQPGVINQIEVFDLFGKKVLEHSLTDDRIDVSTLESGVYILSITLESTEVISTKFTKSK